MKTSFTTNVGAEHTKKAFPGFFPILTWLANYQVKEDTMADILAGTTVAIFHVPQGKGFS